jgi:hypothetical protein
MTPTLYNDLSLEKQVALQKENTWDLEDDIDWSQGVDLSKYFLPLDKDAIAFPELTAPQRLALSQLMGLVINATIGEMEGVIDRLRDVAWEELLRRYPVNPEMRELGELFFEEEQKHARAFARYIEVFCATTGVPRDSLERLMPKAYGSRFLSAIRANARQGGFAFWWVVAGVEEVSIQVYQMMHKHEKNLDPLFFTVHRKHLEDEARHRGYAFLMLELAQSSPGSLRERLVRKTDLILSQVMTAGWVLAELHRIFDATQLKDEHPFFATIAECLPAIQKVGVFELARRMFKSAPYISFVLNVQHQKQTARFAKKYKIWSLPLPKPEIPRLFSDGVSL